MDGAISLSGIASLMPALDPLAAAAATGLLALTFLRALLHKASDFGRFCQSIEDYRLLPPSLTLFAALLSIGWEGCALLGFFLPASRPYSALGAIALLALYSGAMAINLLRGRRHIDCGCGGMGQAISWGLVWRNAALIAVALLIALPVAPRDLSLLDALAIPVTVATSWLILLIVEQLMRSFAHIRTIAEREAAEREAN